MGIEIRNLALRRGQNWLFDRLNFSVKAGDIMVLRGPNGAGKSSLLRAIAGFLPPDEGGIFYNQHPLDLQHSESPVKSRWYSQNDGLANDLTARQSLQMTAGLYGGNAEPEQDLFAVSDFLDAKIRTLSTGQRQRLALCSFSLTIGENFLWLMDEPNSGLDEKGHLALEQLLQRHQQKGGFCILASHIPLCDKLPHHILEIGICP